MEFDRDASEESHGTLGDVLYAKNGTARVSEHEWTTLVRAVAAGDEVALHSLYERAHRSVYTFIVRMTGNRETAEELTLDVFHDVWRRAGQYDPANGTVLGWIMNQARSRTIDRLRFDGRKKRVSSFGEEPSLVHGTPDPHELLAFRQQGELLRGALRILTNDERQAIEAAFFSELTYPEVAARFDVPLGTIKTRIRSGLQKLRKGLAGELAS